MVLPASHPAGRRLQNFRAELPADLAVPADEAGAEHIARAAGLVPVRIVTTPPPRRSFLVWADAPA